MDKNSQSPSWLKKLVNIGLAALALPLVVFALFASLEIVLLLAAPAIANSAGDGVRGSYVLVTLRNFWLLFGGVVSLGLIIYSLDRLFKEPASASIRRYFLRLLIVALGIFIVRFAANV